MANQGEAIWNSKQAECYSNAQEMHGSTFLFCDWFTPNIQVINRTTLPWIDTGWVRPFRCMWLYLSTCFLVLAVNPPPCRGLVVCGGKFTKFSTFLQRGQQQPRCFPVCSGAAALPQAKPAGGVAVPSRWQTGFHKLPGQWL